MEFQKLVLKNFMSFGSQEFTDIDNIGLTLIEGVNKDEGGSNGAGKSSLWDGISWALFAQTVRGLKGDDVINRKFAGDCSVHLHFRIAGREFTVHRYRKHSDMGDRLRVDVDGESVELGTQALTQGWLEREIGIDFDLFRCTVLFAQGETFNFVSAGNKSQKEILGKVMRVAYDVYLEKAKAKFKTTRYELDQIERDISVLKSHIVEDPAAQFKNDIEEWDADRRDRLKHYGFELKCAKEEMAAIEVPDTEDVSAALAALGDRLIKLKDLLDDTRAKRAEITGEVALLNKQLGQFEKLEGECPTCRQDIEKEHIHSCIDKIKTAYTKLSARQEKFDEMIAKLRPAIEAAEKHEEELQEKIELAKSLARERAEKEREVAQLTKRVAEIKAEVNPHHAYRDEAIEKQKKVKEKLELFEKRHRDLEKDLPYYEFWVEAFGDAGIKSFVFDLVCSALTNKANEYINVLTNGSISVTFDTQKKLKSGEVREKFDCSIIKDGEAIKYETYSGGEKRRISLAVDMALADLMSDYHGSRFNVIVFDEQTNGLDLAGRQAFMELLKKLALNRRVFVVDHDAEFKSQFDDIWQIVKSDGISRMA